MLRLLATLVTFSLLANVSRAQTTWYVDGSATPPGLGTQAAPYASIQYALDRPTTVDGDTVRVLPGTYAELVDFVGKSVVLESTGGAAQTTIDGTGLFSLEQSVVKIRSGQGPSCVLSGFTLRGGEGTLVTSGAMTNLFAGGGLFVQGASPTILDCVLTGNEADAGAGAFLEGGTTRFERCTFELNSGAAFFGGGAFLASNNDTTLIDCVLRDNDAINFGGAIYAQGGSLDVRDSSFESNRSTEAGHVGLGFFGVPVDSTWSNVTFTSGFASDGNGGALNATGGTHDLSGCQFVQNSAGSQPSVDYEGGGAWFDGADVTIDQCAFDGNRSATGGALALRSSTATVTASSFDSNYIEPSAFFGLAQGGAIYVTGPSSVQVTACSFTGNEAYRNGFVHSPATARGGAICSEDPGVVIDDCAFVDNRASYWTISFLPKPEAGCEGGAIAGPVTVRRSTFWKSRAVTLPGSSQGRCEGGTLFGVALAEHCTIVDSLIQGAGPLPDVGPAATQSTLLNCIVRDVQPRTLPALGAGANTTFSNIEGGAFGVGNIDLDPEFLSPLSGDFHLSPASPSIDAGDPASPLDPDGSLADQGAFAFDPLYLPPGVVFYCTPKASSSGCLATMTTSDPGVGPTSGLGDYSAQAQGAQGGKVGLFILGLSGAADLPFFGGVLCVQPPVGRVGLQPTGGSGPSACDGSMSLVLNSGGPPLDSGPGSRVWLQAWYRDPLGGAGAFGSALSDAVGVVFE